MSLPGAGETVQTTILEELNRSLVNSVSSLQQIQQEATIAVEEQQQLLHHQKEHQIHPSSSPTSSSLVAVVQSNQIKLSDDDDRISIDDDDDLSADENVGDDETILNENETAILNKSECTDKGGDINDSVNNSGGGSVVDSGIDTRQLPNLNDNQLSPLYPKQSIGDIEEVLNFELQTVANASEAEQLGQSEDLNFNLQTPSTVDNNSLIAPVLLKPNDVSQFTNSRDRSISPPPLPLVTYRWEDCRRSKEKVCYI